MWCLCASTGCAFSHMGPSQPGLGDCSTLGGLWGWNPLFGHRWRCLWSCLSFLHLQCHHPQLLQRFHEGSISSLFVFQELALLASRTELCSLGGSLTPCRELWLLPPSGGYCRTCAVPGCRVSPLQLECWRSLACSLAFVSASLSNPPAVFFFLRSSRLPFCLQTVLLCKCQRRIPGAASLLPTGDERKGEKRDSN